MKHLDLFSGIGGFALAVESIWPEAEHTFVEIDPFCRAVLKKHWPATLIHNDIKSLRTPPHSRPCHRRLSLPAVLLCREAPRHGG
ncbi:DNA cytosine methyltransferase [Candidatus Parcubacteria bacterium]|nr:DNA cytosine methyltransferase [Candidatus Parcubacteria bacterium]